MTANHALAEAIAADWPDLPRSIMLELAEMLRRRERILELQGEHFEAVCAATRQRPLDEGALSSALNALNKLSDPAARATSRLKTRIRKL